MRKIVDSINVRIDEDLHKKESTLTPYTILSNDKHKYQSNNGPLEEAPSNNSNWYVQKNHSKK